MIFIFMRHLLPIVLGLVMVSVSDAPEQKWT